MFGVTVRPLLGLGPLYPPPWIEEASTGLADDRRLTDDSLTDNPSPPLPPPLLLLLSFSLASRETGRDGVGCWFEGVYPSTGLLCV